MDTDEAETVAKLLGRVRALEPIIARQRDAIDRDRRLPASVFTALAEAELFRLWLPRTLGGPGLSPLGFMTVVEAVCALDASVGWVVGNGAGASRIAGYLEPDAAHAIFGDPHALIVTATNPPGRAVPVEGGYRVSGRWGFGSGIHGATAVCGLCAVERPGSEPPIPTLMCCAPISAVKMFDRWHVSGLRGTGSCDWELEDAFVPEAFTFDFPLQRATQPGAVYRMPVISSFTWSVSVVPLALTRALLASFITLARDKVRLGTTQPLSERELIQSEVGRADAMLRAARVLLINSMHELIEAVEREEEAMLAFRARLRQAEAHAAETALRVAGMVETMAGAVAIFESGPIARWLRDVRASVQHVAMSPNYFVVSGRLAMGQDAGTARV